MDKNSVAITGAAGRIGQAVSTGLRDRGYDVRGFDLVESDGVTQIDVTDSGVLAPLLEGCGGLVHLAGFAGERDFDTAIDSHVRTTHSVLEAMRVAGVPRMVYGSSNHAVGFEPRTDNLPIDVQPRPDTFYGLGKVAAESMCRLYVDRHGMSAACLRIGGYRPKPLSRRDLSIWLSGDDAVRLVDACLSAQDLEFAVVYGVSANTRGWFDLTPGYDLGYYPQDDSEIYADEILATPETDMDVFESKHVGGKFCA